MKKVAREIYERIDNEFYNADDDRWWQPEAPLHMIKSSVNPTRVGYFKKKLFDELRINPQGKAALEVGCGGGILCEEAAIMGFDVTGIDPSEPALKIAARHAQASGLRIEYETGTGEALPHPDNAFDVVFCCDVLEHVRDLPKVISEISRVLKPCGVFCYDTINRTWASKLLAIKIAQDWKRWAFMPPNIHIWEMFIKPDELKALLTRNKLKWMEHRGMKPNASSLTILRYLRKRAKGELTYKDLGEKFSMVESSDMSIMYLGYAVKQQ